MASGVEELLDMLFEMVDEAKNVPLSSDKCMIERDRVLDLIDDIKAQFPMELSEAKKIMANRASIIADAKRESELLRKQAEERAKQMLAEESVLDEEDRKGERNEASGGGEAPSVEAAGGGGETPDGPTLE